MTIVDRTMNVIEHFEKLFKNDFFKTCFFTIFVAFFVFSTFSAYAATDLSDSSLEDLSSYKISTDEMWSGIQGKMNVLNNVKETDENIVNTSSYSIMSTLENVIAELCVNCFENGDKVQASTTIPDSMKYGLLEHTENGIIAMMESTPSVDIPSHLAQQWVPGYSSSDTSVYAVEGHLSGYEELQLAGVDVLWGRVRNIAYMLFVVVMIVIGFMIMFRNKLNGQVLVTLGNTIPNVIIALVLVTFSFAIAGLIIDLGGLVLMFIASIYGNGSVDYGSFTSIENPFKITMLAFSGKGNLTDFTLGLSSTVGGIVGVYAALSNLGEGFGLKSIGSGAAGATIGFLVVWLVVIGIVGYGAIKLWFMLIKAYLTILIQVIIAPIVIMTAALPGNMKAFGNWAKGIARNVLAFPLAFAIINLPAALFSVSSSVNLRLPGSLIFEDASTYSSNGTTLGGDLFIAVLEVVLIYAASQAPAYLETILPSNSSPAMQKAGEKTKESLSKMPFFGSLIK